MSGPARGGYTAPRMRARVVALLLVAAAAAAFVWVARGAGEEPLPEAAPLPTSPTPAPSPTGTGTVTETVSPTKDATHTSGAEATPTGTPAPSPTTDGNGGGGGGGGTSARTLAGIWSGTWTNSTPDMLSGSLDITLEQSGSKLSGSLAMSGSPCLAYGTLSGTFDGTRVEFRASEREITYVFVGRVSGDALKGTYRTNCDDGRGAWDAVRVG